MKLPLTLIISTSLLLLSCTDDSEPKNTIGPVENQEVPEIIPDGTENYLNLSSEYIFDQDSLHTFELIIPEDNLALINVNPTAENYVEGQLVFNQDTISPVGVRYKGSIGAYVDCTSGSDWANPSGYKTCTKLSMKIKINWEGREDRFYKLKKLQFHSMNNDPSQMHDRLGYHLFREMGVPAPRAVHAKLIINGKLNGLFALVEQIDGKFTDYHFDDENGNVYKEIWPLDSYGMPFTDQEYITALRTNEDDDPSVKLIKDFANALSETQNENQTRNTLEEYLHLDKALAYAVVDRTIRHDDGPFHWYCGEGKPCASHNFYWYEEPTKKKLNLIAWDLDNAFDNIIVNSNPVTPIADNWGETRNDCEPYKYGWLQLEQWSAACDILTGGLASYEEEYQSLKEAFITGPFAEDKVNALLDEWKEQIHDATVEARAINNDAIELSEWENNIEILKDQCRAARN